MGIIMLGLCLVVVVAENEFSSYILHSHLNFQTIKNTKGSRLTKIKITIILQLCVLLLIII
jgi:hypothetical protein